jgi:hypothetical protein
MNNPIPCDLCKKPMANPQWRGGADSWTGKLFVFHDREGNATGRTLTVRHDSCWATSSVEAILEQLKRDYPDMRVSVQSL